jgi:hypothetical protein
MCFVWLSEETVPFALNINNRLVFITEVESVYCAVQPESLYKTDNVSSLKELKHASLSLCFKISVHKFLPLT